MRTALLLTLLASLGGVAHSARILAVMPFPSKSHSIWHFSIFRLLAQRGHEIVVYSAIEPLRPIENVTHIKLHNSVVDLTKHWNFEEFMDICKMHYSFGFGAKMIMDFGFEPCEAVFKSDEIKKLLNSKETFDLVLLEPTLAQESLMVFGHRFKAPVVNFQGFGTWSLVDWITGNALSISHIPEVLSFPFTNQMTFTERLRNLISTFVTFIYYHFDHLPRHQKIVDQYYKDPSTPPLKEMLKDISITLVNAYKTMEYPRPYTPNVIPIGGAHMSSHMTPLPQNIQKFMDDAKDGVIFFSLGTVVPAHIFPKEYIQHFLNAFRKLSQKVLWKIELDDLPELPRNVMLTKWVPQPTVLAHPNCVLFMTHGGLFSQHEALHSGIPVVAIPFFGDQRFNVKFYEHLGVGVKLDITTITEESVSTAINTVLSDHRYKENSQRVSRIIRDQDMSPADSAVFWVEYVLRHGGAQHLRPASVSLPWYQLTLLDVLAVILTAVLVVIFLLYKISKKLFNVCFRSKRHVSEVKKRN